MPTPTLSAHLQLHLHLPIIRYIEILGRKSVLLIFGSVYDNCCVEGHTGRTAAYNLIYKTISRVSTISSRPTQQCVTNTILMSEYEYEYIHTDIREYECEYESSSHTATQC